MIRLLTAALLLAAAAHAAPVMVVRGTQYLDGWQLDANGWLDTSVLTVDDVFYVSSSIGNDSYDGTSGTVDGGGVGPKATLAAGVALLGAGDWLLLKRGDDFSDQGISVSQTGGVSKTEPMLFGAYGTGDRPLVFWFRSTQQSSYQVIRDIHFVAGVHSLATYAFFENLWTGGTEQWVIPAENGGNGCYLGVAANHAVVSRCILDDHIYNGDQSRCGMYFEKSGLILSESYFFGDRFREELEGEKSTNMHAIYCHAKATDVTIDNCTVLFIENGGLQARGTADITDCLGYRTSAGAGSLSHLHLADTYNPDGSGGLSARNVNIHCAFTLYNLAVSGAVFQENIFIGPLGEYGIIAQSSSRGGEFTDNIIYKGRFFLLTGTSYVVSGNTFWGDTTSESLKEDNSCAAIYTNNTFWTSNSNPNLISWHGTGYSSISAWEAASGATGSTLAEPSFVAPDRDMESYLEDVYGQGDIYADEDAAWHGYWDLVSAMDRDTYDEDLEAETINAYIRAGFEVAE